MALRLVIGGNALKVRVAVAVGGNTFTGLIRSGPLGTDLACTTVIGATFPR